MRSWDYDRYVFWVALGGLGAVLLFWTVFIGTVAHFVMKFW